MNALRARAALVLVLSATTLAACGDTGLQKVRANLVLDRTEVAFGDRPVLATEVVKLTNMGKAPLEFTVAYAGDDTFTLDLATGALDGGSAAEVRVRFRPLEQKGYAGTLTVTTAEDAGGVQSLAVTGAGTTVAAVVTAPETIDFGRVGEGRTAVKRLRLTSTGTAPLELRSLALAEGTSPAYAFVGSTRTPQTLDAHVEGKTDAFAEITVKYAPTAESLATDGRLVLTTNDPARQTIEVPLTASVNRQPVAQAGSDRLVPPGSRVALDGSASTDPDGDLPLTYQWSVIDQPATSNVTLTGGDGATPSFVPDEPGGYTLQLIVTDAAGLASKPAVIRITAVTSDGLRVVLTWNQTPVNIADLDLHVLRPGDALDGSDDCFGDNRRPDWGNLFDASDDPLHGGDKLAGFGPEYVGYEKPLDGAYRIVVRYAKTNGAAQPQLDAVLRVYLYGAVVDERTRTMTAAGEVWEVGSVDWPSGKVTP
jgi:hypothetical protein